MRPKISATASSVPTLDQPLPASSSIPETAQVATPSAAAETSTRSKNLIVQILLEIGWVRGAALARCGKPCWRGARGRERRLRGARGRGWGLRVREGVLATCGDVPEFRVPYWLGCACPKPLL